MPEELIAQIKVVAKARQYSKEMADKRAAMYNAFMGENSDFFANVTTAASVVTEAEGILRELTLKAYADTGNKAPAPGVGIREVTKLEYDEKVAFTYAKEHLLFLQLNKTAFEKFAKDEEPDFVTIIKEPQATIATDLTALEEK